MNQMTPELALARLLDLATESMESMDLEDIHIAADDVLCDLIDSFGHPEIAKAFIKIRKWYA